MEEFQHLLYFCFYRKMNKMFEMMSRSPFVCQCSCFSFVNRIKIINISSWNLKSKNFYKFMLKHFLHIFKLFIKLIHWLLFNGFESQNLNYRSKSWKLKVVNHLFTTGLVKKKLNKKLIRNKENSIKLGSKLNPWLTRRNISNKAQRDTTTTPQRKEKEGEF